MDEMRERILEQGGDPEDYPILRSEAKPEIFRDLEWIWEGFTFLSGSRGMGMSGPLPLPLSEMLSYLNFRGIQDVEDRDEFVHLCQHLDRRFMADALSDKGKRPPPAGKSPR